MMDDAFLPRTTRREFLRASGKALGFLALSQVAPSFVARAAAVGSPRPDKDSTILVLVQLAGGNDGLNTVIPYEDDRYYNLRPTLGIPKNEVLPLGDTVGLHPSCSEMHRLFSEGKLSVLQNVGYPNPNRSHFRSMEIWETASDSDDLGQTGWISRFFDNACEGAPSEDPEGIYLTKQAPQVFDSENFLNIYGASNQLSGSRGGDRGLLESFALTEGKETPEPAHFLSHTYLDALAMDERIGRILKNNQSASPYPNSRLAKSLDNVARMIRAGLDTRVYFVSLGGFDTHSNQEGRQAKLLSELSGALLAFQNDLESDGLDSQVTTMTFSEFGRRPLENESKGTDHGTAAPLFVMGSGVKTPIYGDAPSLDVPENGDLSHEIDFRSVYASVLENWLNCPSEPVLGRPFETLPIV
ncbi:DUF1501 domain-containing protein [Puniceicoccus vermicola]|uniref:DUF1501 domain-containing protein n=1 Tax=Puniceicoccus vermicola TaxID=388746 RepID=A0A7X1AVT4_9BACT|nr:DUF1501 domain-containing protein [Puniceicoccus vermicola]MBC2600926.1 DUF1501 domain-containing protein [Puniceicoccus vermicola]